MINNTTGIVTRGSESQEGVTAHTQHALLLAPTLQLERTVPGSALSRLAGRCSPMGDRDHPTVLGLYNKPVAEPLLNIVSSVLGSSFVSKTDSFITKVKNQ